ncbi:cupin domain-containing protein [Nocardia sp. alder85J]|uniref:cupin domain-containing protein n=1 Tax=Nocardia sp. alder85J TaxID=2862949 RepID=UPI001CD75CEF|nr:cupin domain-containing protein [Nocardia sp. alder85J]MCX4095677.1 cupin domain-containing protein [Nocardia sp. alder85J]
METTPEYQRVTDLKQKAGPITRADRMAFFDMGEISETAVPLPTGELSGTWIQALVNPLEPGGFSLLGVRYEPNSRVERHRHDVPQIVIVLEGEIRQGRRVFGPGSGYYTPADVPYKIVVGPDGARLVEFRATPLTFRTEWLDKNDEAGS